MPRACASVYFFLLYFLGIFIPILSVPSNSVNCNWGAVPEYFLVKNFTCNADMVVQEGEIGDLLGCAEGRIVHRDELKEGASYLIQKNKFEQVSLEVFPLGDGYGVSCDLIGDWTFNRVYCRATIIGKDHYKNYYLLQPGDHFDEAKHADSLFRIKEALRDQGYLNPEVVDTISRDPKTKTVSVTLTLRPGSRFSVHATHVCLMDRMALSDQEHRQFTVKLEKKLDRLIRGETYSKGLLDHAVHKIEELCVRRGFLQVSVEYNYVIDEKRGHAGINFSIELGDCRVFEFFGNHFFTDNQLLDQVMLFGKSALFLPPTLLAEDIIELYQHKGFWDVEVTWEEEDQRCFFCIKEGARARVSSVVVEGAESFSQKIFDNCFRPLTRKKAFEKKILRSCRDEFMRMYVSAGFWDCSIENESFQEITPHVHEMKILICEGEQRLLNSVSIEGFDELMQEAPFVSYQDLVKPIPFNITIVQKQRQWLLRHFQEKGYLGANPKPDLVYGDDGIDLVWRIEGSIDRVGFGKTIIVGSCTSATSLIMRELDYSEGDVWDQKKLDVTLARLRALGIFERISLRSDTSEFLEGVSRKNVIVNCLVDDPFELRLRGGLQSVGREFKIKDMSFRTGGSFLWKNPADDGDHFKIDADITGFKRDVVGCYTMPWMFDSPIKTELKGYSIRFDQPLSLCSRDRLYRLAQDGFSVDFTGGTDHVQGGVGFGFESMEIKKISKALAAKIHFAPRLVEERVPYFYAEPMLLINYLDDAVNPTLGSLSVLSCKLMAPFEKVEDSFFKILAEQSFFFPVATMSGEPVVCAFRLRGGHIVNQCFAEVMPSERFYLGGAYSLRGYEADLVPPLSCFTGFADMACIVPIGGKSMINATIELRLPMYKQIGAVIFNDCGALAQDDVGALHPGNVVGATGIGIRYATPVGPVRFDIGWKWRKLSSEKRRYAWFLTLGHAF